MSIHHFWDSGGKETIHAGKQQLQSSFIKCAKFIGTTINEQHLQENDICITTYELENQVNNTSNMRMIYTSKGHLYTEVQSKDMCFSSPIGKNLSSRNTWVM
jgi:hypothetical protein